MGDLLEQLDWKSVGVVGVVIVAIVVTGIRRVWMFTWVHDRILDGKDAQLALLTADLERERRSRLDWQTIALTQAGVIEQTVRTSTEIVRKVASASGEAGEVVPS